MKFLTILILVAFLALTTANKCPDCDDGGTQDECRCQAFKRTIPLTNETDLFCCGEKISAKRWKGFSKAWNAIKEAVKGP